MKPSVLIVDDSLTVRMDLGEAFEAAGFTPTLCATGAEAREALARGPFALVALDVLLPDADGLEILRELKGAPGTASLPVLLLSTEAEVRDRIRGLRTGADEYVGKPYDAAYVVGRARELVRRVSPDSSSSPGKTVLVIDDSPTSREELRGALEAAGYRVATAASGEEGLYRAVDLRPDAVIVDGRLPGIDGPTVVRRMRQDAALRRTPSLLLTAAEGRQGELQALDAGADAFVRKEEGTEVILARLVAVLRASGAPSAFESGTSLLGPKKILAVDDSLTYLQEIADQLRQEGYDCVLARSGQEAIDMLGVQTVDCILLDLVMPGLSGHETCLRIKGSPPWRHIPLIILTSLDEREAMLEGINAGADDYITKSSDFEVLRARLRAQLRRKQFEDENRTMREQLLRREMEAAEARAARELAETRATLLADLEQRNEELEAFSYSVSHDLRAPLRSIDGFSAALLEECRDKLDAQGADYLRRVRAATLRMGEIIDALLELSRVGRADMRLASVELSAIAGEVAAALQAAAPERQVELLVAPGMTVRGDGRLLRTVLENLLGNAWKFTAKRPLARIECGSRAEGDGAAYFVRDNGAGFEAEKAQKLFRPFLRLHSTSEFAGTGIGLATVRRIIHRHGGRVWAEGAVDQGATFLFTLGPG
ncbi:MAG: response regulator [Planctomycetes bacterium]|nr:response regulator [Planctomycetota bacterium]